ncbi:hypothetical protein BH24DEI2_BH24DEI2_09530 [soil metagenome]
MKSAFDDRLNTQVRAHSSAQGGPVVVVAERRWGAPHLFQTLASQETCVWLELDAEDEGDPVAAGNKLSDALARAFGVALFGHGMPYGYGLKLFETHLALLQPFTFILSGADFGQDFADALTMLHRPGHRTLLKFATLPKQFLIPDTALLLQTEDLRLTQTEAAEMVAGRLGAVETQNLHRATGGALETFSLALCKRLGLLPPLRPHPTGCALPPGEFETVPPEVLLTLFVNRRQWLEALEVAAEHRPGQVPELLPDAGSAYLERGLYRRLGELLEEVCTAFEKTNNNIELVSPCLYLARAHLAHLTLHQPERAHAALQRCRVGLAELSDIGFQLMAGPAEAFAAVKRLWRGQAAPLRITFLGGEEVRLENGLLELYPQWREVLALLALHPKGLTLERLSLLLYGEDGNPSTLKATLSKLRRIVPISRAPYRLDVPYEADFLQLETLLREGRLRAALELYKGPLLPNAEAPGIHRGVRNVGGNAAPSGPGFQRPRSPARLFRTHRGRHRTVGGQSGGAAQTRPAPRPRQRQTKTHFRNLVISKFAKHYPARAASET